MKNMTFLIVSLMVCGFGLELNASEYVAGNFIMGGSRLLNDDDAEMVNSSLQEISSAQLAKSANISRPGSPIDTPSFINRNKGKILATGAVVGGVAYYAATRGLRPETMAQDLRTAKDFCVRNAGKAQVKTVELAHAVREQAPVLLESGKAKLSAGLAIATGCMVTGWNLLVSLNDVVTPEEQAITAASGIVADGLDSFADYLENDQQNN